MNSKILISRCGLEFYYLCGLETLGALGNGELNCVPFIE
jgi:hypothetical protein